MYQNTLTGRENTLISIGVNALQALGIVLVLCAFMVPAQASDAFDAFVEKHFIIGGQPVERNVYPWIVALSHNADAELVQRQFCGGSVIADQWVLTAAHCLFGASGKQITTDAFKIAINATNLNDENVPELDVTNIFIHPEYEHNSANPHSDIALIELAQSSGVTPIAVSTKPSDVLTGLQSTAIGWGAVDISDPAAPLFPIWLHSVDLPIVSLDVCNQPQSYDGNILPNQLCAGFEGGGKDSCIGDSGGPLVVTIEGVVQQVGVVSFGFGCALPNFYGVYTDVPYYIEWINQYVFVGEPEFEPEPFAARVSTGIQNSGTASGTNNSAIITGGASSLFVIFTLITGIMIRRRAC